MAEGDAPHSDGSARPRSGRLLRRISAGLVMLVLVSAGVSYELDLGPRWFGQGSPSPVTAPAEVLPPAGLTLPTAAQPAAVAETSATVAADKTRVRRAVEHLVASPDLGDRVAVQVTQLDGGRSVYRVGPDTVTPASTMKLLTVTAALAALGPEAEFTTRVVSEGGSRQIVLVGGGDPLLARAPAESDEATFPARADLDTLATLTAKALKASGRKRIRLGYDTSLFTGPPASRQWERSYLPDHVVSAISPLWVDEGREREGSPERSVDPAADAAAVFAKALARHGVTVRGAARPVTAGVGADELASVASAPLGLIVQHVLEVSDNEGAEVLARQVAIAQGEPASFAGGGRAVKSVLGGLGVKLTADRVHDGSGLSRQDRLHVQTLLDVIATAASAANPELRSTVSGLPVAGFTGSLAYRFQTGDPDGLGLVRAKTGTLSGVHGLAGTVTTVDGVVLGFVAIADRVPIVDTLPARAKLDEIAAALAGCACAATP